MLVLFETSSGYALFKLLDEKKLTQAENLYHDFETPEAASRIVKLKYFEKFFNTTEALAATTASVEGKLSKSLKKLLKKVVAKDAHDQLLVADAKLGNVIKDKYQLTCLSSIAVQELMRCIRSQMNSLLTGLPNREMAAMALGLAHSLSRYKLKFSPDKIDTMIVQAVCLLDDLDKELNNYVMRTREWYGWHFPELGKVLTDNIVFVKTIQIVGTRENIEVSDLSDILPEEMELKVKEAAKNSTGTDISETDLENIHQLCDQVIHISSYRTQLFDYLKSRMMAMAPNLTVLVGEMVGARLISHAGSLINLAKHPASTVQILGAEKALFRALKTKRDTPKYGLIYHSQLVGQTSTKNKGKISRMLAAKASLATRVDALGEDGNIDLGVEHKVKIETRLRLLEEGNLRLISGTGKAKARFEKYHSVSEVRQYPAADDSTLPAAVKRKYSESFPFTPGKAFIEELSNGGTPSEMPPKKKRKRKHEQEDVEVKEAPMDVDAGPSEPKKKKKKKIKLEPDDENEMDVSVPGSSEVKVKKNKKYKQEPEPDEQLDVSIPGSSEVKVKKNKKYKQEPEQDEQLDVSIPGSSEVKVKKNKKHKQELEQDEQLDVSIPGSSEVKVKKNKKHKQEPEQDEQLDVSIPDSGKKKKKKKSLGLDDSMADVDDSLVAAETPGSERKKKKKKSQVDKN